MSGDLMEMIHDMVGCTYLSDLRMEENREHVWEEVNCLNSRGMIYAPEKWNELLSYLYGAKFDVRSQAEAIERMRELHKGKRS